VRSELSDTKSRVESVDAMEQTLKTQLEAMERSRDEAREAYDSVVQM